VLPSAASTCVLREQLSATMAVSRNRMCFILLTVMLAGNVSVVQECMRAVMCDV